MEKEIAKETIKISCEITISQIIYDFIENRNKQTMKDLIEHLKPFFKALEQLDS